jgi:hypothetical protein
MDYFANPTDYLLAEAERIDLAIQAQVARTKQQCIGDKLRGFYIFEREPDALLKQVMGYGRWNQHSSSFGEQPDVAVDKLKPQISPEKQPTRDPDIICFDSIAPLPINDFVTFSNDPEQPDQPLLTKLF